MNSSQLAGLVGHWVQIRMAPFPFGVGVGRYQFGIVNSVEEGALILRTPAGDDLFLPTDFIRELIELGTSPTDAESLLRASEAPEEPLLRPAESGPSSDPFKLLRPD